MGRYAGYTGIKTITVYNQSRIKHTKHEFLIYLKIILG